jgi:hypothetical protein
MWAHRIEFGESDSVELRSASLSGTLGVCDDEPFAAQPAAALCSASLIDDDLVLTAGHCLGSSREEAEERCRRLWVVFDYMLDESDELALESADSVYACRRVVHHTKQNSDDDFLDMAVLQLDRNAIRNRTPIPLAASRPEPGERVLAATHGAGLPLKVDDGGQVLEVPADANYFVADTDSFAGGSGGPLYNEELELIGHQVRGQPDWTFAGDCARVDDAGESKEQHQIAATSLAKLCETDWPSERLCGEPSACGDGICNAGETHEDCAADCAEPSCGDGLCERSERLDCAVDCRAFPDVPVSWASDPLNYQLGFDPDPELDPGTKSNRGRTGGCAFAGDAPRAAAGGVLWLALLAARRRQRTRVVQRV